VLILKLGTVSSAKKPVKEQVTTATSEKTMQVSALPMTLNGMLLFHQSHMKAGV
jgi:hypothetical protein